MLPPPGDGAGVRFYRVRTGAFSAVVQGLALGNEGPLPIGSAMAEPPARAARLKTAAGEMYDVITVTKNGYIKGYLSVSKAETTGVALKLPKTTSPKFSFFVTGIDVPRHAQAGIVCQNSVESLRCFVGSIRNGDLSGV